MEDEHYTVLALELLSSLVLMVAIAFRVVFIFGKILAVMFGAVACVYFPATCKLALV